MIIDVCVFKIGVRAYYLQLDWMGSIVYGTVLQCELNYV